MDLLSPPHVTHPGLLIAIGGAEDKTRERVILRYFLEAAGGPDANIVVLATASERPETGERYADLFLALRAETVEVLKIDSREEAMAAGPEAHDLLEYATGLFLTGGSQLKLSSALGGTEIARAIRDRHAAGMVVAGTSAGAALLSEHMIALGESGSTPRRRQVHLAKGLGLAPDLILDQYFRRRDRLGRLLTALSYNPAPLGVGIDEDTAAILSFNSDGDGELSVLGAGAVMVVDRHDRPPARLPDRWLPLRPQAPAGGDPAAHAPPRAGRPPVPRAPAGADRDGGAARRGDRRRPGGRRIEGF
jgi:cyanophycinase